MLIPEKSSAERSQPVGFIFQFGHPFEHQLSDASKPESLVVLLPDGKIVDLAITLKKETKKSSEQKEVSFFRFQHTPEQRGDFVYVLKTAPLWMEEEQMFLIDTVRVTLHVLTQKGWDHSLGKGFELVPLTRPYGLQPGMVYQAQALADGKPLPRILVEIERMNLNPPKNLPHDEQITRTVKTDPNGIGTCTLTEPGWWCITANRMVDMMEHQGKMFPVRERSTFWLFVDDKAKIKEGK